MLGIRSLGYGGDLQSGRLGRLGVLCLLVTYRLPEVVDLVTGN